MDDPGGLRVKMLLDYQMDIGVQFLGQPRQPRMDEQRVPEIGGPVSSKFGPMAIVQNVRHPRTKQLFRKNRCKKQFGRTTVDSKSMAIRFSKK